MPIPKFAGDGLPLGRWPATPEEVEAAFVAGRSERRKKIWADWLMLTEAMRDVVGVMPAAWVSGSFLTLKDEPKDIDSVYIVEFHRLLAAKIDPDRARFLQVVAGSLVKDAFDIDVDSFILEWVPRAGVGRAGWAEGYLLDRGYWDDLWSRERSADRRTDSVPRRGYLEVIVDGYT